MRTYKIKIGGETFEAKIVEYTENKVVVDLNGDKYDVEIEHEEEVRHSESRVHTPQAPKPAEPAKSPQAPLQATPVSAGAVVAPIPGVVRSIAVKVGDAVNEGDVLLILEAMKMENQITARSSGVIKTIAVSVGDSVQEDQKLIEIEEN